MTALRQIEAAELMSTVSNYSATLAKTILAASATEQLAKPGTRKAPRALSPEQVAQLEQEMTSSQAGLAALKDTYGADRLELQVACRYLVSVAEKKGTKMAAKWSPVQRAVWSEPFPLL